MTTEPTATVVVVCRDRWSLAPETLHALVARTDPRHPIVVIDARAPRPVGAVFDRLAAIGRIGIARRPRVLGGNEARNVGAEGARTEWLAFVENDVVVSDGWLDVLLALGERTGAASVYPAFLEPADPDPVVHGLGCDLELGGPEGRRFLRERQHHLRRPWSEVAGDVHPVARVQAEPHVLAMRREFLDAMGGFDEALLGWFDHTDVGLHHLRLGAESWLAPTPRVSTAHRLPSRGRTCPRSRCGGDAIGSIAASSISARPGASTRATKSGRRTSAIAATCGAECSRAGRA